MMFNNKKNNTTDKFLLSENKLEENKTSLMDIRSIKIFNKDNGECSSDDEFNEIYDKMSVPDISTVKRKEDKFYQCLLPIDNGFYDGTVNEKYFREGLGIHSINNGEEYYSGSWKDDKHHGYGYILKNHGSIIYYGEFENGNYKQGYGKFSLENNYEYQGTIKNGKFDGLGILFVKISGLKNIDTLKLVAEWENGKTKIIYKNEIKQYYEHQCEIFRNSLDSIIKLNDENRQIQRQYFQNLIDLLDERLLNLNLLNQITIHSMLPTELKSSADLLYQLHNSYINLKIYTEVNTNQSYTDYVKICCEQGLKIYALRLASIEDKNKFDCISTEKIFNDNLKYFTQLTNLLDLKKVLLLDPIIIDLVKKMIRYANERLIRVSLEYRSDFIKSHSKLIENIWMDYFKNYLYLKRSDDKIDEKCNFYINSYSNLLDLSLINPSEDDIQLISDKKKNFLGKFIIKNKIELIIYEAMIFVLKHSKPWRDLSINELSLYFKEPIHQDTSIREIENKLLINILEDSKTVIEQFKTLNSTLESIISYYKHSLLVDKNLKYQNKMKDIIQIIDYSIQISEREIFHIKDIIIDLQFESIKIFIEEKENLKELIDHFLNFNFELSKLTQFFNKHFSNSIHEEFYKITSEIILLIEDLFKIPLEKIDYEKFKESLFQKYNTSDLEIALRRATNKKNLYDAEILLELDEKINVNAKDSDPSHGKTALHWAVINKDKHFILRLLEKGADENIKDVKGLSSFDYAKNNDDIDLLPLFDKDRNRKTKNLNHIENKLYFLQKINNFLVNLVSIDFNWFITRNDIIHFNENDENSFEKINTDFYRVKDIKKAKNNIRDSCSHYILVIIKTLLEIVTSKIPFHRLNSFEMIRIRAELIMSIGKSLKYFDDQIKYTSLEKFKNDCVNPFEDIIMDINSYQDFCNKLEKIDLYFLYNRKLKEITIDKALQSFKDKNGDLVNFKMIKNAFLEYENIFKEYFNDIMMNKTKSIDDIIKKTKNIADQSKFQRDKIPIIIAGLSIIFSLKVSNFIEKNHQNQYILKDKYNENYFLQPHCIQILGIFILLDINGKKNVKPSNHFAEILTGQGKSWALALLAGYFSLIGYQVTIGCYSDYLTQRDEKDFKIYFDPFNFMDSVKYKTLKSMCEEKLINQNYGKTLRDIIDDILSGKDLTPDYNRTNQNQKSILLIDEVDVFFSYNFGTMFCPGLRIKNKCFVEIQKNIWQRIVISGEINKIQLEILANEEILNSYKQDKMLLHLKGTAILKIHLENMINTASNVYFDMKNKNILQDKYEIRNDIIYIKDNNGKFVSTEWCDYETSFYYLKLMYEKAKNFEKIHLNENNFGYLSIRCGLLSYSELPNSYDGIFGVSGTLNHLSIGEKSLLKYYNIEKQSYYPSFFDGLNLKFDMNKDFLIEEYKTEWFETIFTRIRKQIEEDRSVLVFFYNESILSEFFNRYSGYRGIIPFFITENEIFDGEIHRKYTDSDFDKLIKDEYAGHHGKVTLLTRAFGRGIDFQAETKVIKKGGIHVIQTFFSMNIKEEIQIRGRTARKDDPGSFELVLCLKHLQEPELEGMNTPKFVNVTKNTSYKDLDEQRIKLVNISCQDKLKKIQNNKQQHQRTLSFFQRAMTECNDNNRGKFIEEIETLK